MVTDAIQSRERAAFEKTSDHLRNPYKLESLGAWAALRQGLLTQQRDFDDRDPAEVLWKAALRGRGYIVAPDDGAFQFGFAKFKTELAEVFQRVAEWAAGDFHDVPPHATKPRGLTVMELFEAYQPVENRISG